MPVPTRNVRRAAIIELARALPVVQPGVCEVDDNAKLSEGRRNGAWVQAWVWVNFEGTPFHDESRLSGKSS